MSYDHPKFVHPVPMGYTIPKGTVVRYVESLPFTTETFTTETFFTAQHDYPVTASNEVKYYLDYDITKPTLPTKINSVIYNVEAVGQRFPVAVRRATLWSAFNNRGVMTHLNDREIESFDLTPPVEGESCNHNWQPGAWQALCCLDCGDLTREEQ